MKPRLGPQPVGSGSQQQASVLEWLVRKHISFRQVRNPRFAQRLRPLGPLLQSAEDGSKPPQEAIRKGLRVRVRPSLWARRRGLHSPN
eukprot:10815917-Alexandrium_andersonii.AAC.1